LLEESSDAFVSPGKILCASGAAAVFDAALPHSTVAWRADAFDVLSFVRTNRQELGSAGLWRLH
jgi:hypothetical protein